MVLFTNKFEEPLGRTAANIIQAKLAIMRRIHEGSAVVFIWQVIWFSSTKKALVQFRLVISPGPRTPQFFTPNVVVVFRSVSCKSYLVISKKILQVFELFSRLNCRQVHSIGPAKALRFRPVHTEIGQKISLFGSTCGSFLNIKKVRKSLIFIKVCNLLKLPIS
jgi:hypothetical protein